MTKTTTLELTSVQQAAIADAFTRLIREADEAYTEFGDMTPEEWRALKADAAKERRRPKPPASPTSKHTDAVILGLERQCVQRFDKVRGRKPLQREIHTFISNATGLEPSTCRDRLLKARKNKG